MKLDAEEFLKQLIAVLLTLRAKCSLLALKPAMSSPYLPKVGEAYLKEIRRAEYKIDLD
jgi:hypothetical protein